MGKGKKATIKDVAQLANVSPATVSLVINGHGSKKFPEATCRRVMEACNQLGYARTVNLRSNDIDEKVLVAIVPSFQNQYYVHLAEAMQQRARELGYSMLVFDTFWNSEQERSILRICNSFPFAGILFTYPSENEMLLQQTAWRKPVVYVYDKNLHTNESVLGVDNIRAGEIVAEYLLKLGHDRIAYLTSTLETKQVIRVRRLNGLRNIYKEHGYDPELSVLLCSPDTEDLAVKTQIEGYELGYLLMKRLIDRDTDISAIVAVSDMIAFGAMDAILDAGKRIPQDYSIIGYDNVEASTYKGISLTTVECYGTQTGREAVDMLVRKLERGNDAVLTDGNPARVTRVEYFPRLIIRKTTAPKKSR